MAKTTKKASGKTALQLSFIKKGKLSIDLSKAPLTDIEIQKLLNTVQKMVASKLKEQTKKLPQALAKTAGMNMAVTAATTSATIEATFFNTIPGNSELTATHNGIEKSLKKSDSITFENVSVNDLIRIDGFSQGNSRITINRTVTPPREREFPAGDFGFHFIITE